MSAGPHAEQTDQLSSGLWMFQGFGTADDPDAVLYLKGDPQLEVALSVTSTTDESNFWLWEQDPVGSNYGYLSSPWRTFQGESWTETQYWLEVDSMTLSPTKCPTCKLRVSRNSANRWDIIGLGKSGSTLLKYVASPTESGLLGASSLQWFPAVYPSKDACNIAKKGEGYGVGGNEGVGPDKIIATKDVASVQDCCSEVVLSPDLLGPSGVTAQYLPGTSGGGQCTAYKGYTSGLRTSMSSAQIVVSPRAVPAADSWGVVPLRMTNQYTALGDSRYEVKGQGNNCLVAVKGEEEGSWSVATTACDSTDGRQFWVARDQWMSSATPDNPAEKVPIVMSQMERFSPKRGMLSSSGASAFASPKDAPALTYAPLDCSDPDCTDPSVAHVGPLDTNVRAMQFLKDADGNHKIFDSRLGLCYSSATLKPLPCKDALTNWDIQESPQYTKYLQTANSMYALVSEQQRPPNTQDSIYPRTCVEPGQKPLYASSTEDCCSGVTLSEDANFAECAPQNNGVPKQYCPWSMGCEEDGYFRPVEEYCSLSDINGNPTFNTDPNCVAWCKLGQTPSYTGNCAYAGQQYCALNQSSPACECQLFHTTEEYQVLQNAFKVAKGCNGCEDIPPAACWAPPCAQERVGPYGPIWSAEQMAEYPTCQNTSVTFCNAYFEFEDIGGHVDVDKTQINQLCKDRQGGGGNGGGGGDGPPQPNGKIPAIVLVAIFLVMGLLIVLISIRKNHLKKA